MAEATARRAVEKRDGTKRGRDARRVNKRRRRDGYTELPNEATAVDFVQPLYRIRLWSCNRLSINNVLLSGAHTRRKEKEKKDRTEERRSRRREENDRRKKHQRCRASAVVAVAATAMTLSVLVDDVVRLVYYPCIILIVCVHLMDVWVIIRRQAARYCKARRDVT